MSAEEYDKIRQINIAQFNRFCDRVGARAVSRGLTERKLAQILKN